MGTGRCNVSLLGFLLLQLGVIVGEGVSISDKQWAHYHDQQELETILTDVSQRCAKFTSLYSIGNSVEGRDLLVIQFSTTPGVHQLLKPEVKYVANMHGNEPVGRELLLRLADHFCAQLLANNTDFVKLMETTSIHLMPTMNPDGFELALMAGKAKRGWLVGRTNANGVDLNRDFPDLDSLYYYMQDNNIMRSDHLLELFNDHHKTYQPETQAVGQWILSLPFVLSANLHEGDLVANYPFDSSQFPNMNVYAKTPDDKTFKFLAESYANKHPLMAKSDQPSCDGTMNDAFAQRGGITNGAQWYSVSGGMQDFNYLASNAFEITLELSCEKFPDDALLPKLWADNKNALIDFIKKVHLGVKGIVRDKMTGRPIENAVIWTKIDGDDSPNKHPVTTWSTGEYNRLLLPGSYQVYAMANGYQTMAKRITVTNNRDTSAEILNFELVPERSSDPGDQYFSADEMQRLDEMVGDWH